MNKRRRKGSKCANGYKRPPGEKKPTGDYKLVNMKTAEEKERQINEERFSDDSTYGRPP